MAYLDFDQPCCFLNYSITFECDLLWFCRGLCRSRKTASLTPASLRVPVCRTGWLRPAPHVHCNIRTACRDREYVFMFGFQNFVHFCCSSYALSEDNNLLILIRPTEKYMYSLVLSKQTIQL